MARSSRLLVPLFALLACLHTSAETVFIDTFSDGDAMDGSPVSWDGPVSVVDGSLVLGAVSTDGNAALTAAQATGVELVDVSVRSQFRINGTGRAGIFTRFSGSVSLNATINTTPDSNGLIGASFVGSPDVPVPGLDLNEDVIIQVDSFGSQASMWVWNAGDDRPELPLQTRGNRGSLGTTGVTVLARENASMTADYRYFAVSSTSIPEPSSACVALIGLLGVTAKRRRSA